MYTTMEYYSNVFPYIYINMIKVGELSGSLTNSLEQAVKYLDDTESLNRKLKSILIPNIIQFVLLIVMLLVGTLFAIPAIQGVFDEVGTEEELPAITLWFADFVDKAVQYWYIPVLILIAIVGIIVFYINTPKGKYNFHYFKYRMPIFGELIFALDFHRLMKAMLLNLRNGMRIQESIEVSKNVVKNYVMLSIIETSINNILIGQSWIEPFEKSGLAKPMITEMLKIGMQTDLPEMMEKLVEYMQIDIDNIMTKDNEGSATSCLCNSGCSINILRISSVSTLCTSIYGKLLILSIWGIRKIKWEREVYSFSHFNIIIERKSKYGFQVKAT